MTTQFAMQCEGKGHCYIDVRNSDWPAPCQKKLGLVKKKMIRKKGDDFTDILEAQRAKNSKSIDPVDMSRWNRRLEDEDETDSSRMLGVSLPPGYVESLEYVM